MAPPLRNRTDMPFRRLHQSLPHWVKVLINFYFKRFGDPGDRYIQ